MLSARMKKILLAMSEKSGIYSSEELASLVNVSSRTIKNDIQNLNECLSDYGAKITSHISKGYELRIDDLKRFQELLDKIDAEQHLPENNMPQYRYERVSYIIKKLLSVDYYIRLEYLADELFVSRRVITNDLREVREKLSEYHLSINVKPNYGISLEGNEIDKRLCISEYFFHNDVHTGFFAADNAMFVSSSNQKEISYINDLVIRIISKYDIFLYDYSTQNFVVHVLVAIRRWRFYNYVHMDGKIAQELKDSVEFKAAQELCSELEKYLNIILPVGEVLYFALHLQNKRVNETEETSNAADELIEKTLFEIYLMLQQKYHFRAKDKTKYEHYFRLHIPVMVQRLRNGMVERNQLTYEIINKYPLAFHISMDIGRIIEKNYGIKMSVNEFSYMVLYTNLLLSDSSRNIPRILLACCQGRPEMITILNELNNYEPELVRNIDVCTLYTLQKYDLKSYDIILTTVPIHMDLEWNVPTFYISNKGSYIKQIRYVVSSMKAKEIDLCSFIKQEYFLNHVKAADRDYAIQKIARQFDGRANEVYSAIWESERAISGETGRNMAYIHTERPLPQNFIFFEFLKKPIIWHKQWVQYIIWINLAKPDITSLSSCYQIIADRFEVASENGQLDIKNEEELKKWLIGDESV